jgi:PAS domain S-box-containing protein
MSTGSTEREAERIVARLQQTPWALALLRGPDHVVAMATGRALRLLGHGAEVGRSVRETAPQGALVAALDRVLLQEEPQALREVELGHDDAAGLRGRLVDVLLHPSRRADGAVEGVTVLAIEVGDQVADVEALRAETEEARSRMEAVIAQMPAGVIIADARGRLLLGNEQVERIWGRPFEDAAGIGDYGAYVAFHPDGRRYAPHEWPLARALVAGEEVRGERIGFQRGDGRRGTMEVSASPIRAGDGTIIAAVVVFHDVTARTEAEERLHLLLEVSTTLDAALGVEPRLERFARFLVPRMADICLVRLNERAERPRLVAVAHREPGQEELAWRLYRNYRPPPSGVAEVMRSGRAQVIPVVEEAVAEEGRFDRMRLLGARSYICAPLVARGAVLGAVSLMHADSERRYDDADLALAEELGRRAGLAIDNARRYEAEQALREAAERAHARVSALQRATAGLAGAATLEQVAGVIVREGMAALGAAAGIVGVREGEECRILAALGYPSGVLDSEGRLPLDAPLPLTETIRSAVPLWLEAADQWPARFAAPKSPYPTACAIPLLIRGRPIGAIGFRFAAAERAFDAEERAYVGTLAEQCAQALERAGRHEEERRVAETLQRSLLPARLPAVAGVALAVRYLVAGAGAEAGGDWYEAFPLDDGGLGLAVGDVVGRGVRAAAAMGQLRSAMRAFGVRSTGPAAMLTDLARFADGVDDAMLATVAYAVLDPRTGDLRYACAGHPPPLLASADGQASYLSEGRSVPLAAFPDAVYREAAGRMEPGGTLVLYSDGLVERRGESLETGLARLARAVRRAAGAEPEEVCDRLVTTLIGRGTPKDDVALLVLRWSPSG